MVTGFGRSGCMSKLVFATWHPRPHALVRSSLDVGLLVLLAIWTFSLAELLKVWEADVAILLAVLPDVAIALGPGHGRPVGRVGWLRVESGPGGEHWASWGRLASWGGGRGGDLCEED
jgi:hypothetical protein